jgi:hypothetical protein
LYKRSIGHGCTGNLQFCISPFAKEPCEMEHFILKWLINSTTRQGWKVSGGSCEVFVSTGPWNQPPQRTTTAMIRESEEGAGPGRSGGNYMDRSWRGISGTTNVRELAVKRWPSTNTNNLFFSMHAKLLFGTTPGNTVRQYVLIITISRWTSHVNVFIGIHVLYVNACKMLSSTRQVYEVRFRATRS